MFKDSYFPLFVCICMTFPVEAVFLRKHHIELESLRDVNFQTISVCLEPVQEYFCRPR